MKSSGCLISLGNVLRAGRGWRARASFQNNLLYTSCWLSGCGRGIACFTSGSHSYDTGSRKLEFQPREKGRATTEFGLSRSDGTRGLARCSRPSHVGLILLTGVVLLPEDRKTGYHWWAFRRLLGSPGHPGFLLLLGPVVFLRLASRASAQVVPVQDPSYFGG